MAGDGAVKVIDVTKDFGHRYAEVVAWRVPASERYPEGIKYSMQYGNAAGETIVRYDNFPDHPGAAHHQARRRWVGDGYRVRRTSRALRAVQKRGGIPW